MNIDYVDIFDENGVYTGEVLPKREAKEKKLWHKAIHIWIVSKDKILIQKRNRNRKLFPGYDDIIITQHILSNETSLEVALNELKNTLGINVNKEELEYLYCIKRQSLDHNGNFLGNLFIDTYLLIKDINIEDLKVLETEIEAVKLIDFNKINDVIDGSYKSFVTRKQECIMFKYEMNKRSYKI